MLYSRSIFSSQINSDTNNVKLSVNDIATGFNEKMHDNLYSIALESMKKELLSKYLDKSKYEINFIEIINQENVLEASSVIVVIYCKSHKEKAIERFRIDLSKWWPNYDIFDNIYINKFKKPKSKFIEKYDLQNFECIYKDYVEGTCKIKSKITNQEKTIPLKMLYEINQNADIVPDSEALTKIYSEDFYSFNY